MEKIDNMIEEISSDLQKYDDAGLIDKNKVYRDIIFSLRKFGNDVCVITDGVVEIKNGKGKLPDNFFALNVAYLCEPSHVKTNIERHYLQKSMFYSERVNYKNTWNECDSCCNDVSESIIKENIYLKDLGNVEFSYKNPQMLRVAKTSFGKCNSGCRNKFVKDNPNEISINETTISANFSDGYIYIQYYGFPIDEEGNIDMPETSNGELEMYVEYYCKRRLAERLIANNDAQGLSNMYSIYRQEEAQRLRKATYNLKMSKISPKTFLNKWRRLNQLETLTYELNF